MHLLIGWMELLLTYPSAAVKIICLTQIFHWKMQYIWTQLKTFLLGHLGGVRLSALIGIKYKWQECMHVCIKHLRISFGYVSSGMWVPQKFLKSNWGNGFVLIHWKESHHLYCSPLLAFSLPICQSSTSVFSVVSLSYPPSAREQKFQTEMA